MSAAIAKPETREAICAGCNFPYPECMCGRPHRQPITKEQLEAERRTMPTEIMKVADERAITPMVLIEMGRQQNASVEQMAQLFELQLRFEADQARKSFNRAFSGFKSESVRVIRNTEVKMGPLAGTRYANLFDVVSAVTPVLSKYGLSHSWKLSKDEKDWMEVTCTISHEMGHSESVHMGAAPDTGPGRNAIQARGSAKSYLERYTLLAATGLAASDTDDDGAGTSAASNAPRMADEDYQHYVEQIAAAGTRAELRSLYEAGYKIADDLGDAQARSGLIAAKDRRKAQL